MSEYSWTGAAGDNDFGDAGNWIDTDTGTPGEPGSGDIAVFEAAGSFTGTGDVAGLYLIATGGTITTLSLNMTTTSMGLEGNLTLTSGTEFFVSDDVLASGTATIVQSNGSAMFIYGNDGTAADVVTAMTLGQNTSDKITYTVTGLGTQMNAEDGNIMIAGAGTANVTVANGGTLEADNENNDGSGNVFLAGAAGAKGSLTVTGAYSTLELAQTLNVGEAGSGSFTLSNGADAELGQDFDAFFGSSAMIVGVNAGSSGTAIITGAGTRLASNVYGAVLVGSAGTGSMTISAGATGNFGALNIGTSATGIVTVTGSGSVLQLHQAAIIGYGVKGTLQVLSGAHLGMVGNAASDDLTLGLNGDGGNGTLVVSGAGSVLSADNQQVQVGYVGTGVATVSSGGALTSGAPNDSASHAATIIGAESGSVGSAVVENANSIWTAKGEFDVGYYGKGTLLVESGGAVTSGNYNGVVGFVEGNQAGGSGTVTVTGTGSKITNNGRFVVGGYGTGALTISTGATVTTALPTGSTIDGAIIGGSSGGVGKVTVSGTAAKWTIGTDLVIGSAGTGMLTVGAGGTVSAASLLMASTGAGTLTISGSGAKLAISGNALFGNSAKASVSIGAGSILSVGGTGEIRDGSMALSGGSLSAAKTLSIDAGQAVTGYGTVQTAGLINAGTVQANGGTLSFIGGTTGTGKLDIGAASTLSLGGSVGSGQQAIFQTASSKLVLGAAAGFAGTIYDFIKGDTIDLSGVVASSLTYSGGTLTVHESGSAALALKFSGSYTQSSFGAPSSDGHGGTFITHT